MGEKNYPNIKISMGGGFPNTELRSLGCACFEFFDFITLDDGEMPIDELFIPLKIQITIPTNELFIRKRKSSL
jgi:hypothetical protein